MTTRSRVWRALGALAIAGVTSTLHAATASAASCAVRDPSLPPVEEVLRLRTAEPDPAGAAVIGTVTAIRPAAGATDAGRTDVLVDVTSALGIDAIPNRIVVSQADTSPMNGYPFVPGTTYFIPLQLTSPDGRANGAFVCDPIQVLTTRQVSEIARRSLGSVTVTRPVDDPDATLPPLARHGDATPTPTATEPAEPARESGSSLPAIVATTLICGALLVFARYLWTRDDPPRRARPLRGGPDAHVSWGG